ncbi:MAG: peptidylprolyl isomerase [Verrucomicrobiota bacterium]
MMRFLREPLVQFLLMGGCIYLAYALFGTPEEAGEDMEVRVDASRIDGFISEWERRWNRPPTREEVEGLIEQYVRNEILYRQAVAMGLNEDDPITRRRMAQKLQFLTGDLLEGQEPGEGELEAYYAEHEGEYREADEISFVQVYFNPDGRGNATLDDATVALEAFRGAGVPDAENLEAGDRSMMRRSFESATEWDVGREMGAEFADAVMELEPGAWHGPVLSGFGVHLVYVFDREEGVVPALAEVKEKVFQDWREARQADFDAEFFENLKGRYEIVIDEVPEERMIGKGLRAGGGRDGREES